MPDIDFVAIDFEHATPNKGTVCSIGIATVKQGEITDQYKTLIQPPNNEYFIHNSRVHGIYETDTTNAPTFKEVWPEIKKRINNQYVVAHGASHTDRHCLQQAMEINDIQESLNIRWIDTQKLCNAQLEVICKACDIVLNHNDSLSDAIACAKILMAFMSGTLPEEKIIQSTKNKAQNNTIAKKEFHAPISSLLLSPELDSVTNKNNPFYNKKVVITGIYETWPDRDILAMLLKNLGADIDRNVGKYTNILCAGSGCGPSKLKKIQDLIDAGKDAKILYENELIEILNQINLQN